MWIDGRSVCDNTGRSVNVMVGGVLTSLLIGQGGGVHVRVGGVHKQV